MSDKRIDQSRLAQRFKTSDFYEFFVGRLQENWQAYHVQLRHANPTNLQEIASLQARLAYIEEILDWFESTANYEVELKQIEQQIKSENDY